LLTSNRKTSSSKQENSKKPSPQSKANAVPMMGEFEGKFIIDALTTLLQQNPGKVFNVAQVIEALYGELDPEEIKEVKASVLNELSRGHRTGIFSRVPGEKGVYTWDVKLLSLEK
jgi:FKBP-type peptidyl-prolyl cis-trans isomerase 2